MNALTIDQGVLWKIGGERINKKQAEGESVKNEKGYQEKEATYVGYSRQNGRESTTKNPG